MTRRTYTAGELADFLGVGKSTVYQSVKDGTCPITPIRVSGRLVWSRPAVDLLLGIVEVGS